MITGIVMVTATGLLWSMVGIIMSNAARNKLSAWDIMRFSSIMSLFIGLLLVCFDKSTTTIKPELLWKLTVFLSIAGAANISATLFMQKAMQKGHHGTIWIICQSALIAPFLMGVLWFGEQVNFYRLAGLTGIIICMLITGLQKKQSQNITASKIKWLLPALAAFALYGLNQCLATLPSFWRETELSGILRAFLFQTGAVSIFIVSIPFYKEKVQKNSIKPAILLSATTAIGQYFLFYQGLDRLAEAGTGAIGFPLTIAACIIGFSFYSLFIIREKTSKLQYAALITGIAGIILISIK